MHLREEKMRRCGYVWRIIQFRKWTSIMDSGPTGMDVKVWGFKSGGGGAIVEVPRR